MCTNITQYRNPYVSFSVSMLLPIHLTRLRRVFSFLPILSRSNTHSHAFRQPVTSFNQNVCTLADSQKPMPRYTYLYFVHPDLHCNSCVDSSESTADHRCIAASSVIEYQYKDMCKLCHQFESMDWDMLLRNLVHFSLFKPTRN